MPENGRNIWDKIGCELPNGQLCTACCTVLEIPELKKESGTNCEHQSACRGCAARGTKQQPKRCKDYHCSTEQRPNVLFLLTGATLLNGEVTQGEANETQRRLLG